VGTSDSRDFGVDGERPRQIDAVAVGEHRVVSYAMAVNGKPDSRAIDSVPRNKAGGFDRISDRRVRGKIDVNAVLHDQRRPSDRNSHGLLA